MKGHHDHKIRVRYAETDQMGVAYYSNYLVWFEVGRTEFCRRLGIPYERMERETESYLVVAEARCRYFAPLRYDNEFVIRTWLEEFRRRTMVFSYQLIDPLSDKVYAQGSTKHVVTGPDGRPKSFPKQYRSFFLNAVDS